MGMTKQERLEKQKQKFIEMKKLENELHGEGYKYIAGVDEVGRGPLAGPVVTAAVVLPEDFDVLGIDDSKKLSEKKREELYDIILENCLAYGIGMRDHNVIDEINILQATKLAMLDAISNCNDMLGQRGQQVDYVVLDAVKLEDLQIPQKSIIKGDANVLAIAAASIVAKVTRDRMMVEFSKEYPYYAFERNKGYGTAAHYQGIKEHGICEIHRKSFLTKLK